MIFRQLLDPISSTYTYLLAERHGGEALIIDPVVEQVDQYVKLISEIDLKLVLAVDTHVHADYVTGIGRLRETVQCASAMGEESGAECVSLRIREGDVLKADGVRLRAMYTPGHTDDSYSLMMDGRVFTGQVRFDPTRGIR